MTDQERFNKLIDLITDPKPDLKIHENLQLLKYPEKPNSGILTTECKGPRYENSIEKPKQSKFEVNDIVAMYEYGNRWIGKVIETIGANNLKIKNSYSIHTLKLTEGKKMFDELMDLVRCNALERMDGMSLKSKDIPHSTLLKYLSEKKYYEINSENDCFKLTEAGKDALYYFHNYLKYR